MHRLFVALRPPESVREMLFDAMEDGPAGVRWQDDEQLHLTLRFVGEIERPVAEDLANALATIHAPLLSLALAGVGQFDQGRRGVLWAGVEPRAPLKALHDKIDRACLAAGVASDRRAFHPHITLGRWSGGAIDPTTWLLRHAALSSEAFEITSFGLYESILTRSGAHYEQRANYSLA